MSAPTLQQAAVFVDAGYIYAQGAQAAYGQPKTREQLSIRPEALKAAIEAVRSRRCPEARLLRIYWYDSAMAQARLSPDQWTLSREEDVKFRRGGMNSEGRQKGVDSLIVTDLIELARNGAISDAVLVSGDGDLSIGVQIAQGYGVRVHVVGVSVAGRSSVSSMLLGETDTREEWAPETLARILVARPDAEPYDHPEDDDRPAGSPEDVAGDVADDLTDEEVRWLSEGFQRSPAIPSDIDRRLLTRWGAAVGRELSVEDKRKLRSDFRAAVLEIAAEIGER